MQVLRTPDECFESLDGYAFEPHYTEVPDGDGGRVRIHHVDEGQGETVLLLHGEPSWSYLYRKMIPLLTDAGFRAVAPDLVGFGRSDKPAQRGDYTYQRHVDWIAAWLDANNLNGINLFCQDWGGLIGLRLAAEHPDRFARIVAANTMLPTGDEGPPPGAFMAWRKFSQEADPFVIGQIVNGGCTTDLSDSVIAGYDAPFPDDSYKEGAREFPVLVPIDPDDPASEPNRRAWKVLEAWDKPFLTAFGDSDPILGGAYAVLRERIPAAQTHDHVVIEGGGHFLQEDRPDACVRAIADLVAATG